MALAAPVTDGEGWLRLGREPGLPRGAGELRPALGRQRRAPGLHVYMKAQVRVGEQTARAEGYLRDRVTLSAMDRSLV